MKSSVEALFQLYHEITGQLYPEGKGKEVRDMLTVAPVILAVNDPNISARFVLVLPNRPCIKRSAELIIKNRHDMCLVLTAYEWKDESLPPKIGLTQIKSAAFCDLNDITEPVADVIVGVLARAQQLAHSK